MAGQRACPIQAIHQQKTPRPQRPEGPLELPGKGGAQADSAGPEPEGSPLGDQLLMAHQLVAGVFIGLSEVAIAQVLEAELHGGEHRMVVVHRAAADSRILRESVAPRSRPQFFVVGSLFIPAPLPLDDAAMGAPGTRFMSNAPARLPPPQCGSKGRSAAAVSTGFHGRARSLGPPVRSCEPTGGFKVAAVLGFVVTARSNAGIPAGRPAGCPQPAP